MKSFCSFLFLLLFLNINSVNAQNTLTKEQAEFVEIIKAILLNKEVNKFLEENSLFWMAEGKTVYILNENTPFYEYSKNNNYRENYKAKTKLCLCDRENIFFVIPEKFIAIKNYKIVNDTAIVLLEFVENGSMYIFKTQEFNLHKEKNWRIIN